MFRPVRWMLPCLVLGLSLCTAGWLPAQEDEKGAEAQLVLKPSGLEEAASVEGMLPRGAAVHVRIKSAELLLNDVSAMAVKFVPEKALSPEQRKLLEAPNPLLALIGMQTMRRPLTIPMLAEQTGIDPARAVTLSLYTVGPPDKAFILAVPARDLKAVARMLGSQITGMEDVALEGGSAVHVQLDNVDLFLVSSPRTVCVCGSRQMAQMLFSAPAKERLDTSPFIAKSLAEHADDNLVVVLDAEPVKPMLPALKQMGTISDEMIHQARQQILHQYPQQDLPQIDIQLRRYLKVRDHEQLLDYLECILVGGYEAIVDFALAQAEDFEGVVIGADLAADMQRLSISVHSRAIAPSGSPLPLAEAARAVAKIPGSHNHLLLTGQSAPASKPKLVGDIVSSIAKRSRAKGLPPAFAEALERAYSEYQPEPTLESKVPWTVTSRVLGPEVKGPGSFNNLQAFLENAYYHWYLPGELTTVCAIPRQAEGFMAAHFKQAAEACNKNDQIYRRLREASGFGSPSYARDSRLAIRQLPGGVVNYVRETSYTTQWGLFGFNEHELINREFTLCRDVDNLTLMYPGGRDANLLTQFEPQKTPKAISRLLAALKLPQDANSVEFLRAETTLLDFADLLGTIETKIQEELAAYLKQVEAAQKKGGSEEEIPTRIRSLEIPIFVYQLKQTGDGKFYVVAPGGVTFPRPALMPEVLGLLKEFRANVDTLGGMAAYQRQAAGKLEVAMVVSTEGAAMLVKSVGNQIAERYLADPEQMQRVQQLIHSQRDAAAGQDTTIMTNPQWKMLDEHRSFPDAAPAAPVF